MTASKNLKEALFKQRIKKMHKVMLRKILTEQEHSLYSTFIQPFTDVIDAAKLTGQDILSTARLSLELLTTLSPKKMEAAISRFDSRKAKIAEKWKPIKERNDSALSNADLDIAAMIFAPGAFFASEAAIAAYKSAGSMNKYLIDSGWKIPFASTILGYKPENIVTDKKEEKKSILGRLAGLFYIEGHDFDGALIIEQEDATPKKEPDFKKAMKKYLEETGLTQQFKESAKEFLKAQEELINEVLSDAIPRLELISQLQKSSNVDEFIAAIEESKKKGLDLKSSGMESMKQNIMDSAKKLADSEEFRNQIAEESQKSPEEVSEKEIAEAAKKVAFVNAKQEFDKNLSVGKETLKNITMAKIKESVPDEKNLVAIKTTNLGLQYIKLVEDSKQKIQNS